MSKKKRRQLQVKFIGSGSVSKAVSSTQQEPITTGEWNEVDTALLRGYRRMVSESRILPQCIQAYASNIAGFGMEVTYKDEYKDSSESSAAAAEFVKVSKFINCLSYDAPIKKVFEEFVKSIESYGIGYLEVVRNLSGEIVEVLNIRDVPSISKSYRSKAQLVPFNYNTIYGDKITRQKRFIKYRQQSDSAPVYYKEFGDPRFMDKDTGEYSTGKKIKLQKRANEIIEYRLGDQPYGEPRWIGQVLGIDGSRRAESLNNNYFRRGRHTPLLISVQNGTLTGECYEKLKEYMRDIEGEKGEHGFILLEFETKEKEVQSAFGDEKEAPPTVQIKDMGAVLQKDELFQDYQENNRKSVQSAFNLPDIYVGYTTDFNRATAQVAQEITEQQVFIPKREALSYIVNDRLLNDLCLKYTQVKFSGPDTSNPEDIIAAFTAATAAGGTTPNMAKAMYYKLIGENYENFPDEYGNTPIAILQINGQEAFGANFDANLTKMIEKAMNNHDEEIVVVIKQVRDAIRKMVVKNNA